MTLTRSTLKTLTLMILVMLLVSVQHPAVRAQETPPTASTEAVSPTTAALEPEAVAPVVQPVIQPIVLQPIIATPAPTTVAPSVPADNAAVLKLDLWDVFMALTVIALIVYGVYRAAKDSKGDPRRFDQGVTTTLERVGSDRERMDRLETMFAASNDTIKEAITLTGKAVGILAAVLPGQALDTAAKVLDDIQQPGPPPPGTYHVEGTMTPATAAPISTGGGTVSAGSSSAVSTTRQLTDPGGGNWPGEPAG